MLSIRFTYNTVTPESALEGDFESQGFCNEYGHPITENTEESCKVSDEDVEMWTELGDLEYYIRRAIDLGISEPSCSEIHSGIWFSTTDPDRDYTIGSETHYSLHLKGLTDSEMIEVHNMLCQGYLSDNNEYWLENLEESLLTAEANKR